MGEDIIAFQGYMARWLSGYNFLGNDGLRAYDDIHAPVVVYGGYYADTLRVIREHKGIVIIVWAGADTRKCTDVALYNRENVINLVTFQSMYDMLRSKGIRCYLSRVTSNKPPCPLVRGGKVYTYIHQDDEKKYNRAMVDQLRVPYEIFIARLLIDKKEWYGGVCDEYYSQSFIGLALSDFTGGGYTIFEMGLRGIRVVTNIIDMPHTIPWRTREDIERAINGEAGKIGTMDAGLADEVCRSMIDVKGAYDLSKVIIDYGEHKEALQRAF